MRALRFTNQFKKDLRLMESRGFKIKKLHAIVNKLRDGVALSPIDDDHPLRGPWDSYRGCHVQGDWCLIYRIVGDIVELARTGTHSDLFE
jgi:mRNA interferase YafQ